MDMEYNILSQRDGILLAAKLASERNLIPVFGSGFTRNTKSHSGKVPDGAEATKIMKELLLSSCTEISQTDLDGLDFNSTSEYFLKLVSHQTKSKFFTDFFSEVFIEGDKKDFLQLDWPYAYTLNVDDGIENSSEFKAILPYNNFEKPNTSIKLLYKIHGDAFTEATSNTSRNIVFSSEQYILSLTDESNIGILNNIEADYSSSNLLFIGCSLISEPDLKFIYDKIKENSGNNLRIVLRKEEPQTLKDKMLLSSYGINTVILVEDYDLFYQEFISETQKMQAATQVATFKYKNPKTVIKFSKADTTCLISGINIFDAGLNVFFKSGMHLFRNAVMEIEKQLKTHDCVVVKGRRFSGKTYILCSVCERQTRYTTYFFPSNSLYDEQLVSQLLNTCNNSLFLFDSNSLSGNAYILIANSGDLIRGHHNKIILASNSNDNFMMEMLNAGFWEIDNYFDKKELLDNNKNADKYALSRRLYYQSNFDYLYMLSKEQKISMPLLKNSVSKLTSNEQKLLLLLVTFDKVFLGDVIPLGIYSRDIDGFINKFPIISELVSTEPYEKASHSSKKIVHNGKMLLLEKINELNHDEIRDCIVSIVKVFKNDRLRYRLYIEIILFDTLNQIFGGRKGAGHLIYHIYESLEAELYSDLHYWLQRAKSIYRLRNRDKEQLDIAYSFAKKVYIDGHGKLYFQAALSLSLICCALSKLEDSPEKKISINSEAISYAHTSIFSDYYRMNNKFLKSELQLRKKEKGNLWILCEICQEYINLSAENDSLISEANELISKLNSLIEN